MSQVDQKFEFSRRRLVLEETLGEGEFGRVLAGRALDAAGTGYTRSLLLNFKSWLNIERELIKVYAGIKEYLRMICFQGCCQNAQVTLLHVWAAGPADWVQPPQGGGPPQRHQAAGSLHRQVRSEQNLYWANLELFVLLLLPQFTAFWGKFNFLVFSCHILLTIAASANGMTMDSILQ